jgi:hypothetical protein
MKKYVLAQRPSYALPHTAKKITSKQTTAQQHQLENTIKRTEIILKLWKKKNNNFKR